VPEDALHVGARLVVRDVLDPHIYFDRLRRNPARGSVGARVVRRQRSDGLTAETIQHGSQLRSAEHDRNARIEQGILTRLRLLPRACSSACRIRHHLQQTLSAGRRNSIGAIQAFLPHHAVDQLARQLAELGSCTHLAIEGLRVEQRVVVEQTQLRSRHDRLIVPTPA